jgi:hypothetical protein
MDDRIMPGEDFEREEASKPIPVDFQLDLEPRREVDWEELMPIIAIGVILLVVGTVALLGSLGWIH